MLKEHLEHYTNQALLQSEDVSSQRIEVKASDDGVVTLEGQVQSYARKLAANEIAQQCDGVVKVINNLTVAHPDRVSDLEIAEKINNQMADRVTAKEHAVRVDVNDGQVRLSGYVSAPRIKQAASDLANGIEGVRDVVNMLVINPDRVLANEEVSTTIRAALSRIIGMENDHINVTVVDEQARLSGSVNASWKRKIAEEVVNEFGIIKICNDIVVDQQTTANRNR